MTKRARVVRLLRPLSICNFVERKLNFIFVWFAWGGGGGQRMNPTQCWIHIIAELGLLEKLREALNSLHDHEQNGVACQVGFLPVVNKSSEWVAWKHSISRVGHYSIARALFSKCIRWHFVNLRTIIENGGLQRGWKSLHVLLTDVVWWWNISQAWSDCCRV